MSLTFDETTHEYRWNGKLVPSVTEIIGAWCKVSYGMTMFYVNVFTGITMGTNVMDDAAWYGKEIHAAARLALLERLDWDALDPVLLPPLHQLINWKDLYAPEIIELEHPMYHVPHGYAGTTDFVGVLTKNVGRHPVTAIVDFKSGEFGTAGVQLAAYEELCRQNGIIKPGRAVKRYALVLPRDGGPFRFIEQKNKTDINTFNACLVRYRALCR